MSINADTPQDLPDDATATRSTLSLTVVVIYVLTNLACWTAILTPAAITLAIRVQELDPEGASGTLSLVAGVGAAFGIVANPLFGRLSDRTRSRFGRRRPWMLGGIVGALCGLVVVSYAESIPMLVLGWLITQAAMQAVLAPMTAILPDQIPVRYRGRIAGLLSVGQGLATTVGTALLNIFPQSTQWGFLAPISVAVLAVVVLCAVLPDRVPQDADRPPFSLRGLLGSFWFDPRGNADFAWTLLSRLLAYMGITVLIVYQTYFLLTRMGVEPERVAAVMFLVLLVENTLAVLGNVVSGYLSDRWRRRKVFVAGSGAAGTLGFLTAALTTEFGVFLVGVALLGIAKGVYAAVDMAMATDLLPEGKGGAAKNMGLFIVASLFPNLLVPMTAPLFLAVGTAANAPGAPAGNYMALFIAGGVFMFLAAVAVIPIRGVR
ncbi:MFS family permease [Lipingzhangella halophila]|uniref:MFS family permease n=1 Tax=Lipingzhangella halophila TaxID=1783352 RepID=A0A7W7RG52_9ACTN|nr:MFS transporter [Lipingzhangella halophila]MBB4931339.1 MFS family permease [Lipingzhangella halophila]